MDKPKGVSERAWAFACNQYPGLALNEARENDPRAILAQAADAFTEDLREACLAEYRAAVAMSGVVGRAEGLLQVANMDEQAEEVEALWHEVPSSDPTALLASYTPTEEA